MARTTGAARESRTVIRAPRAGRRRDAAAGRPDVRTAKARGATDSPRMRGRGVPVAAVAGTAGAVRSTRSAPAETPSGPIATTR